MARGSVTLDSGEEVIIETGTGTVAKYEGRDGDRNKQVSLRATHRNLNFNPVAWVDTLKRDHVAAIEKAMAEGWELEYEITVHRKDGVDKNLLLSELANNQKVRELTMVRRAKGGQSAPADKPADAPAKGAPTPSQGAERTNTQSPATTAPASPDAPRRAQTPNPPQTAHKPSEPPPAEPPSDHHEAPAPRRGPKVAEAKPWEEYNSDMTPNLGSYAVQAGTGIAARAVELVIVAKREVGAPLIRFIGHRLIEAADEIQAGVRSDGRSDRMDNSHSRARGVLHSVLDFIPFPIFAVNDDGSVDADKTDTIHTWHERSVRAGIAIMRLGVELSGIVYREPEPQRDDAAVARNKATIDTWPDKAAFDQAHEAYTKLGRELTDDQKARIKAWKAEHAPGWPVAFDNMKALMAKVQEIIRADAPPPDPKACQYCGSNPCVCADASAGSAPAEPPPGTCKCGKPATIAGEGGALRYCPACEPF